MVKNEFTQPDGISYYDVPDCPYSGKDPRRPYCFGEDAIKSLTMEDQLNIAGNIYVLLGFFVAYVILAYFSLYRIAPKNLL